MDQCLGVTVSCCPVRASQVDGAHAMCPSCPRLRQTPAFLAVAAAWLL